MKKLTNGISIQERKKYFKMDIMNEFQFKQKCSTGDIVFINFEKEN